MNIHRNDYGQLRKKEVSSMFSFGEINTTRPKMKCKTQDEEETLQLAPNSHYKRFYKASYTLWHALSQKIQI